MVDLSSRGRVKTFASNFNLKNLQNKNTIRFTSRWCLCYCLAACCEQAQYLNALQPVLHALRASCCRIRFGTNLMFPHSPSAQSGLLQTAHRLTFTNIASTSRLGKYPELHLRKLFQHKRNPLFMPLFNSQTTDKSLGPFAQTELTGITNRRAQIPQTLSQQALQAPPPPGRGTTRSTTSSFARDSTHEYSFVQETSESL